MRSFLPPGQLQRQIAETKVSNLHAVQSALSKKCRIAHLLHGKVLLLYRPYVLPTSIHLGDLKPLSFRSDLEGCEQCKRHSRTTCSKAGYASFTSCPAHHRWRGVLSICPSSATAARHKALFFLSTARPSSNQMDASRNLGADVGLYRRSHEDRIAR